MKSVKINKKIEDDEEFLNSLTSIPEYKWLLNDKQRKALNEENKLSFLIGKIPREDYYIELKCFLDLFYRLNDMSYLPYAKIPQRRKEHERKPKNDLKIIEEYESLLFSYFDDVMVKRDDAIDFYAGSDLVKEQLKFINKLKEEIQNNPPNRRYGKPEKVGKEAIIEEFFQKLEQIYETKFNRTDIKDLIISL